MSLQSTKVKLTDLLALSEPWKFSAVCFNICFLPGLIQFYHIYFQIIFYQGIQVNPFVDSQSSLSVYLPPLWYSFPQISVAFATCIPSLSLL